MPTDMKAGSLNLLEPSAPVQVYKSVCSKFTFTENKFPVYYKDHSVSSALGSNDIGYTN